MSKISKKVVALIGGLFLGTCAMTVSAVPVVPAPPTVDAKGYILVDFATGKVLAEGNADTRLEPASLTKMMTSYIIGKEIKQGNLKETDMVSISKNAWAKKFYDSSKMFIEVGTEVSVADLNQGIIVVSGNDACVAMAEHIAGTHSAFADLMNIQAKELGMTGSNFENSHGLHGKNHYTTARDMAILGTALIRDLPEEYKIYKQRSFTFNNITQYNRNRLLRDKSLNVDGMKTGYHSRAGYSQVSSATKGEMRLIAVILGAESVRIRTAESKKMLSYGFRFFETVTPIKSEQVLQSERIWMGDRQQIELGVATGRAITIPRGQQENLVTEVSLDGDLRAPLNVGDVVGKVSVSLDGEQLLEYPLVAMESVAQGSLFSRFKDFIELEVLN